MVTVLQVFFCLLLIVLIIMLVFQTRKSKTDLLPDHYKDILNDYVAFYANLHEDDKKKFEDRVQHFLSAIKVTGVNAVVEDLDRVLVAAGAIIPVFYISDWEYINLHEVLLYPGNFNIDYDQQGAERNISGIVGTGALQHVMILNKWELRQGFINNDSKRNTAIHEFIHLIDKMDGTFDGVPLILMEKRFVAQWQQLIQNNTEAILNGWSDIDMYAATNSIEFFAVTSEYFFKQRELFLKNHPQLHQMLEQVFVRK